MIPRPECNCPACKGVEMTNTLHVNCTCPICVPTKPYFTQPGTLIVPNSMEPISVPIDGTVPLGPTVYSPFLSTPVVNYGWSCPKCQCVYAPSVSECYRCNSSSSNPGVSYVNGTTVTFTTTNPLQEK
jgi:hypothetical protein